MKRPSKTIKAFLDLIDESEKEYISMYEQVGEEDKLTQDLLHALELGSYQERRKIATELAACRRRRREAKDRREVAEVIISWTRTKEGERVLKLLRNTLGEIRKVEQYHANRTYRPRVLK